MEPEPLNPTVPTAVPESDTELKELLEQNLEVAEENQRILKRMVHIGRIAFWSKVVIWTVVLVLPVLFAGQLLASGKTLFGYPSPEEFKAIFHPAG